MNKEKMGRFLRELRREKKLSLEKLSAEFDKEYLTVSTNAISSWENGKTIPDINNLNFLASFYGVSIDEILDGEKYKRIDFETVYSLHKPYSQMINSFDENLKNDELQLELIKERIRIKARTKTLIFKYIYEKISRIEIDELIFLLEKYYNLNPDLTIRTFLQKLSDLRGCGIRKDDMWWIIQRDLRPIEKLKVNFFDISDESYKNKAVNMAVESLENWEKDMLLAIIQRKNPISLDPSQYSSKTVSEYEKEHNKVFDPEQITKNTIRYLISRGARVNTAYFGYEKKEYFDIRPIDKYECFFNDFNKPFSIVIDEEGKREYFEVERTYRNHVLINYRDQIVKPLLKLGYTYDEIINLIAENYEIPDEVYLRAAKIKNLDLNRDFESIKADVRWDYYHMEEPWDLCRTERLAYPDTKTMAKEIRDIVLLNCETMTQVEIEWVGGKEPNEVEDFVLSVNEKMTFSQFKSCRSVKKTVNLLNSLNSNDLDTIRTNYFDKGGNDND